MTIPSSSTEDLEKRISCWLSDHFDEDTKNTIRKMQEEDPQSLADAFYTDLNFGTGGLRGLIGVGTNRMNQYTVRGASQGLANYLLKEAGESPSVVIGYDSRHYSPTFAEEAARVLAANGIKVYLFSSLRSTPLVSFACRHLGCSAAIVITASHNPSTYNGYKVYWSDGAQVLPPHDKGIIEEVRKVTDLASVSTVDLPHSDIVILGEEVDQAYLEATRDLAFYPEENQAWGQKLSVVYTPLHGSGITIVPSILKDWGFSSVSLVEDQAVPDGDFPTVPTPNPEERNAMRLGTDRLIQLDADLLLGTDPDTDRMGACVLDEGRPVFLNGNQIACLCLYHICEALAQKKAMPERAAFLKTIVTTELFKVIAESYGAPCFDVLTGFKYIAEQIRVWEESTEGYQYIFGGEESYGYLLGTHARDKDAAISCALLCEVALHAKLQGKTLLDLLDTIYERYGVHRERLESFCFPETQEGRGKMQSLMEKLRKDPLKELAGSKVVVMEDYTTRERHDLRTGEVNTIQLPASNVLLYWLDNGTKVAIRPSGTEPKVKLYLGTCASKELSVKEGIQTCEERLEAIFLEFGSLLKK